MSNYKKYKDGFVNYSHRGASEYLPENALLSFYTGIYMGFRVRTWGVKNVDVMKYAYDAGVDGMTVNFPDKLEKYRK